MTHPVLHGETIFLRRLQRDDLPCTWEWLHRPDVHERIGVAVPFTPTQQEAWFVRLEQAQDKLVLAVCLNDGGAHVGNVSLDSIDPRHRHARLSIFIADPARRGRGTGSEALRLLLGYAFDYLNLHRVWCKADADDPRIRAFYEALGFVNEGRWREHEFLGGAYRDKQVFGILCDEFRASQRSQTMATR